MKKILKKFIAYSVVIYLTLIGVLVFYQRTLIFIPRADGNDTPAKYGIQFEDVMFPSADGTLLHGWWLKHDDSIVHPTLVYCHGNGAVLSVLSYVSSIFYTFGFDALLFDYRHFGKSEPGPSGLSEILVDADAQAAYNWVLAKGVPENRIVIWGHSLGSSIAAWLASKNHPAGVVLEGAFTSIKAMQEYRYPWAIVPDFLVLDKFDTEYYVTQIKSPILMIHTEKDEIIPYQFGREVFTKAHEPKTWLSVPGIGHNQLPSVIKNYRQILTTNIGGWVSQ